MNEENMILPEGFEIPAGEQDGFEPAQPEAGLDTPGDGLETTIPPDAAAPAADKPAVETPKIKVKYNSEERELGVDEAVPLIQKGMNYDKLQERYNAIQNDPRLSKYEKLVEVGKQLGYQTDDALMEALSNTYYENQAAVQGLTVDQVKKDAELVQRENAINKQSQSEAQAKAATEVYERFLTAYPDAKPTDIKDETWARVRQGADLTLAYTQQKNQELAAEIATLKQNQKNAKAAPITGTTKNGSAEPAITDPFMAGFDSEQ